MTNVPVQDQLYPQNILKSGGGILGYNNITNCITEIPQDIKLELNNGVLTLKAGSKVYKGDGTYYAVQNDVTYTATWANGKLAVLYTGVNLGNTAYFAQCYSGGSEPQTVSNGSWWFDTQNKIMKTYVNGWISKPETSLPIAIISATSSGITSIDRVFNGFGYIGSTVFALPGVKGLIPNGRNADGTLKNIEYKNTSVFTRTIEGISNFHEFAIATTGIGINDHTLNEQENYIYNAQGAKLTDRYVAGNITFSQTSPYNVTSFTPKTAFHAVDWNDFQQLTSNVYSASNIGCVYYTLRTDVPNGGAWCDGALYTKAQFPDVYKMLVEGKLQSTTVSEFDNTVSAYGSCGFFGLDTANERFKVPMLKNVYLKAGQAGEMFGAESLPNIKAGNPSNQNTLSSPANTTPGQYGAAKILGNADDTSRFQIGGLAGILKRTIIDASLSSSTYKDGAKVNPDHVTYRAYVVLYTAKDVTSDTSTEYQLNNPFSLLDYKWSEYGLNNASWLISNGAFHSRVTYPAVYELLLKIKNGTETKDGVSVKLSTETYTDTDFVLNTTDTTFRLPVKVKLASGNAVAGNGMTLGLTDGTNNLALKSNSTDGVEDDKNLYGKAVGTKNNTNGTGVNTAGLGVTTDPTKSGIETSSQGLKLYFYVGETIQDANVINAAGVLTDIATLKGYDYVIESYNNGSNWYRIYKSGWIEQGGFFGVNTGNWASASITYLKPFKDTTYQLFCQGNWGDAGSSSCTVTAKSTTGATITYANNLSSVQLSTWLAIGRK